MMDTKSLHGFNAFTFNANPVENDVIYGSSKVSILSKEIAF